MVTFNFEDGSSMTLQDKNKVEDTATTQEDVKTDRTDYRYHGQKPVSGMDMTEKYPNISYAKTDTKTDTKEKDATKTLKYKSESMRTASPLSVLNQFSDGFIESLLALPDTVVEKTAQGISDTFNLGWNDDDIFQFADLINKGKVGYMGGSTYIGGDGMTPELIEALSLPQNEWEKWARLSGDISGLGASFFTGGALINVSKGAMKYRKLVQTGEGKWEWVTDYAKLQAANKKLPSVTGAAQDYMNWIANNPLKAAQLDLLFSTGGATGLYTADRNMTEEFKEQHPGLASLVEMGALLVGSLAAPGVIIGAAKTAAGAGILLTKTPVAGPVLRFTGGWLQELWSKRSIAAQRAYIRKVMKENVEPKIAKQIQEQYETAMRDPASLYPQNIALVVRSNVVSGDAINALKQQYRNEGYNDEEAMTEIWKLILKTADDNKKMIESLSGGEPTAEAIFNTVQIGSQKYELGELAEQALKAYYDQLVQAGGKSEQQIQELINAARLKLSMAELAPSAATKNTQAALEATAEGERLGSIIDRKQTNNKIVKSFYDALFPTDENAATYVVDAFTKKIISVNKIGDTIENIEKEAIQLAKDSLPILPGEAKVSIGQNLRQTAVNLKKEAMKPFEQEDLYIHKFGDNIKVNNFNWYQDMLKEAIYGSTKKPGLLDVPEELPAIIQRILSLDATPSVLDVWKLYKGLSDQAFDAGLSASMGQGPGKAGWKNLQLAQSQLLDFMQNAMVKIGDRKLSQFFTEYKVNVADKFNRNAAFRVNMRAIGGGYVVADEMVPYEYFKTAEGAEQFGIVYNSMPTNTPAEVAAKEKVFKNIQDVVLDMIWNGKGGVKVVSDEGVIDARKLNKWIEKNDTWLHKFGDLKGKLLNIRDTQGNIAMRIEQHIARQQNITAAIRDEKLKPLMDIVNSEIRAGMEAVPESIRGEIKDNLVYTVNQLMQKALMDPVLMRRLAQDMGFGKGFVDDATTEAGALANSFRKLVWQNVGDKIKIENPGKVLEWMDSATGKNVLNLVYSKPQQKNLKTVLNAYDVVFTTPLPTGASSSQEPWIKQITQVLGSSPQSLTSIRRAWSEGRISGANVLIYVASRLVTAQQKQMFDKLYYQAFSDPKIAETLSKNFQLGRNRKGFFYDRALNLWQGKRLQEFLFKNGISLPLEIFTEPPLIMTNDTDYEIKPKLKEIEDEQSSLAPLNMEIPDVVQASRIAAPTQDERKTVEMAQAEAVDTTPSGQTLEIKEEDYASFFPYDATGQMIAARRAAEGGIMNAAPKTRQRII